MNIPRKNVNLLGHAIPYVKQIISNLPLPMQNRWLILLLLLALALPGIAQKKSMYTYPIGVQAYTFRKQFPKDPIATLDMIQRMGITELEGGPTPGMSPEDFKALCAARGISIPATGCSFEQLEKDPMAVIKQAKALGASYVMCAWIPHTKRKIWTRRCQPCHSGLQYGR